jgi:hypothetical protein
MHMATPSLRSRPRHRTLFVLLCALPFAASCSAVTTDEIEDLGRTNTNDVNVVASTSNDVHVESVPFHVPYSDFYGRWVGEAADVLALEPGPGSSPPVYRFPSGSSQIVLTLEPNPEGELGGSIGSITFGAGALPPPPTAADDIYPVSYVNLLGRFTNDPVWLLRDPLPLPPIEGFAYSARQQLSPSEDGDLDAGVADGVLRLGVATNEVLAPWCALQTPVPTNSIYPDPDYRCVPYFEFISQNTTTNTCLLERTSDSSACPRNIYEQPEEQARPVLERCVVHFPSVEMDCNQVYLCSAARCECDSTHCFPGKQSMPDQVLNLHLRRQGDALIGVFEDSVFLNERGLRIPLGSLTLRRTE